jgi:hypothetical protein
VLANDADTAFWTNEAVLANDAVVANEALVANDEVPNIEAVIEVACNEPVITTLPLTFNEPVTVWTSVEIF